MALQRYLTQGSLGSVSVGTTQNVDDIDEIGLQITGSFVGTIIFQASLDGVNWQNQIAGVAANSTARTTGVISATSIGLWQFDVSCYTHFRVNMSAWTSGTASFIMAACRRNTN